MSHITYIKCDNPGCGEGAGGPKQMVDTDDDLEDWMGCSLAFGQDPDLVEIHVDACSDDCLEQAVIRNFVRALHIFTNKAEGELADVP